MTDLSSWKAVLLVGAAIATLWGAMPDIPGLVHPSAVAVDAVTRAS
jgi:hypothetical protein